MKHIGLQTDLNNLIDADVVSDDAASAVAHEAIRYIEHLESIEDKFNKYNELLDKLEDGDLTVEMFLNNAKEVYEAN